MKIRFEKEKIWTYLSWLWLFAGAFVMLMYHLGPGKALVDGDMGGEMILADLLNQEGDFLLSDNWYHATEIHVFFMQIIFRPLLYIWPSNWHIVRVVGTILIYIINTVGYLLMMKESGVKKLSVWSAGALLWPMGMWRLFLGLYGGQYLVYDFFCFYILFLIFYLSNQERLFSKDKRIKNIIAVVSLAFLSLAGGVNGVRETMMLFAPICLGIVFVIVRRIIAYFSLSGMQGSWKCVLEENKKVVSLLITVIYATFFNLLGYGYNLTVLMRKYSFQSNTAMVWKERLSFVNILESISDFFSLFGFGGEVSFFSVEGLCSFVGIVIAFILLFVIVRIWILRDKLSTGEELIYASFIGGVLFCSVVFGLMEEMDEPRYWLPFMCFGIMLFEVYADIENWVLKNLKGIVGLVLSICIVISSVGTIKTQIKNPHEGKLKNLNISKYLDENGFDNGYAQFWLANTITEQTSGRVKVRPLMYSETFEMLKWSNRIDYATSYPEGEVFLVIDKKGFPGNVYESYFYKYANPVVNFDDDDWLVMTFASANELENAYIIALNSGEVMSQDDKLSKESN